MKPHILCYNKFLYPTRNKTTEITIECSNSAIEQLLIEVTQTHRVVHTLLYCCTQTLFCCSLILPSELQESSPLMDLRSLHETVSKTWCQQSKRFQNILQYALGAFNIDFKILRLISIQVIVKSYENDHLTSRVNKQLKT